MKRVRTFSEAAFLLVLLTVAVVRCEKDNPSSAPSLNLSTLRVGPDAGTVKVEAKADGAWTLTLRDESGQEPSWASIHLFGEAHVWKIEASGRDCVIVMDYDANDGDESRKCSLTLESAGGIVTETFVQLSADSADPEFPQDIKEDPVPSWMELPAVKSGDGFYYINHTEHSPIRNYSYYWSPSFMVARWVAYPLGEWCFGSSGRTDAWGKDKKIPSSLQPNLASGSYKDIGGGFSGYDRGHQLPSADRTSNVEMNKQTFYSVNMTPQLNAFNTGIWQELEGKVRSWAAKFDTVYVVTGCNLDGHLEYVYDKGGMEVAVPSGYFKALLGYAGAMPSSRKQFSQIASDSYYAAIAFCFDHKSYPRNEYMTYAITVDRLEELTGLDFFVNLPDEVETSVESKVIPWWQSN